ncbi:MAG: hypothetical protein EZS28_031320 [Streblomastix strix]|uniref:Uncharacterized protein n=1 Tax=Streblomastix strix TaxID=222440 RepID=A0A5J4UTV3_9EUKA|nr:MAG: hypothetical protein EZS28_031320 [Streblomastix strix]
MNKIHVIYGDTDSLCLGIADKNWPIKNQKLWNKLYPQFFPMSDQIDEKKKLLGWNIEHQVKSCFALAPKCYYLDTYDNGEIMKLKGVNQQQNPNISRNSFIKNIQDDYHTEITRKSVIQKQGLMSEVISNRVGISGINTKTIVLKNQSCAPILYGINADKYIVDDSHCDRTEFDNLQTLVCCNKVAQGRCVSSSLLPQGLSRFIGVNRKRF